MDGVDQLNNILIIGMTNRLDMIDEALLRPGRLEVHMEISLPDEHGRFQILNIHTAKMRTNQVMEHDVDLMELARLTKNFSGAEIGGLIKSATSFAFNRHVKVGTIAGISDDVENLRVNREDFMRALDEVHPAFGVSEEELQQVIQNGIIEYDDVVDVSLSVRFLSRCSEQILSNRNCKNQVNSLWNKYEHQQEHLSLASCYMDPLDQAKLLWEHQLPKPRNTPSSNSFHRIIWLDTQSPRRLPPSPGFSLTVIRVR